VRYCTKHMNHRLDVVDNRASLKGKICTYCKVDLHRVPALRCRNAGSDPEGKLLCRRCHPDQVLWNLRLSYRLAAARDTEGRHRDLADGLKEAAEAAVIGWAATNNMEKVNGDQLRQFLAEDCGLRTLWQEDMDDFILDLMGDVLVAAGEIQVCAGG